MQGYVVLAIIGTMTSSDSLAVHHPELPVYAVISEFIVAFPCNKYCKVSPVPTQTILAFGYPYTGKGYSISWTWKYLLSSPSPSGARPFHLLPHDAAVFT